MKIIGIISEYNPLHLGHAKQFDVIRRKIGDDSGIVCLMSGNFTQRGYPAIFEKTRRAEAAVRCGADLVLELPVTTALRSAEGFAAGGVSILSDFCDYLCFGAESNDKDMLMTIAKTLLSKDFNFKLRSQLEKGISFPTARQKALEEMGIDGSLIATPNNILAVEYCKAIFTQKSNMQPLPILREGSYHDTLPDSENPSATAVRNLLTQAGNWQDYVPKEAASVYENAPMHTLSAGERAVLGKLRCMDDEAFEALPYGSEGLWRKLMHAARKYATLEEILTATKSKRYTRTRLDRMVMCAFLGLSQKDMDAPVPYVRVLALNHRGGEIVKKARCAGAFLNIGEVTNHPYQNLEDRCNRLFGLFKEGSPGPSEEKNKSRIFYLNH